MQYAERSNVVDAGIAKDSLICLLGRNLLADFANHDAELSLENYTPSGEWQLNICVVARQ